jgi:hypothetical protein
MGGGGGNTTSTVVQQNIPEEFYPYFERVLKRGESESAQPYVPYGGQRLAGVTPDTELSYDIVRDVATRGSPGTDLASNVATANVGRSGALLNAAQPFRFSEYGGFEAGAADPYAGFRAANVSPFAGFEAYSADPFADFREAQFTGYEFGPTETMTADTAASYMDPFMRNVVDVQKEQARRDFDIAQQSRNASAIQAGAFGGSRQQVAESMAESDLLSRLRDIEATGTQGAYADAVRRFEADRAARFGTDQARAAELARTQAGLAGEAGRVQQAQAAETARIQNMGVSEFARLQQSQAAELARVQGISIDEAARIQQSEAAELARVQGISIDEAARIQAARASERGRVQAAQAAENQAFINQQMEIMGFSADQAGMVAKLEEAARSGDIQAAQLLESIGKSQQAQRQAGLDLSYEDFLRQQGYDRDQIAFMANLLQGLPIANAGDTVETTPYNPIQQALGAGLAGLSLYRGFQG